MAVGRSGRLRTCAAGAECHARRGVGARRLMNNLLETAHSSGASRRKFCHKTVPLISRDGHRRWRNFSVTARGKEAAALALHRFGFGPARDSIAAIAGDPRGALLSDLDRPGAGYVAAKLPSSGVAARRFPTSAPKSRRRRSWHNAPRKKLKPITPPPISIAGKRRRLRRARRRRCRMTPGTSNRRNLLNHRCRNKYSRTKPRRATRRPSARTSASSSG